MKNCACYLLVANAFLIFAGLKRKLFFVLLLGFQIPGFSQTDSLALELDIENLQEDSASVDTVLKRASAYWATNPALQRAHARKALEVARKINYKKGIANAHYYIGMSYVVADDHKKAIEEWYKALLMYESINQYRGMGNIHNVIGYSYTVLEDFEKAKASYRRAIKYYNMADDKNGMAVLHVNFGWLLNEMGEYDSAIYYNSQALAYSLQMGKTRNVVLAMHNLGDTYRNKKEYSLASGYYQNALAQVRQSDDHKALCEIYLSMGKLSLEMGNSHISRQYLDSAIHHAGIVKALSTLQNSYSTLKELALREGDFESAVIYLESEYNYKRQVLNEETFSKISKLENAYKVGEREKNQAKTESRLAATNSMRTIILISSLCIVTIVLVFVNRQRVQLRKNRELQASEEALTKAERENNRIREIELKNALARKNEELDLFENDYAQKSELIAQMKAELKALSKQVGGDHLKKLNHFANLIDETFRIDKDWENFKGIFEQTDSSFFSNLKQQYNQLSASDLKLCSLLKLNLPSSEISRILGISADSVRTSRYRLRKKLSLGPEDDIVAFIAKL